MKILNASNLCKLGIASALTAALVATSVGPAMAETEQPSASSVVVAEENAPESDAQTQVAWAAIITAVIAAGGAADYMGQLAAHKLWDAGLRPAQYQDVKWPLRVLVFELLTPIYGSIFMGAFENTFYHLG